MGDEELVTLETDKQVNVPQLSYELGGMPPFLRVTCSEEGSSVIEVKGVTEEALRKVLDSHEADPEWLHPNTKQPETLQERLDAATTISEVKDVLADVVARTDA